MSDYTLMGVRFVASPLAMHRHVTVERWPTWKRRRRWHVVIRTEPAAYRLSDGTMVVHPAILGQMRAQFENRAVPAKGE